MSYGFDLVEFQGDQDIEAYKLFALDASHFAPAVTPLFYQGVVQHMWLYPNHLAADYVSDPGRRGTAWRSYKGYAYLAADMTTEAERREREPKFRERMTQLMADPWEPWERWKAELISYYDHYIPMNLEQMGNGELAVHLWDIWDFDRKVWEIHMLAMGVYITGFMAFRKLAAELIGLQPEDPVYAKLVSGFDNAVFQLNRGLAQLAQKALELKLEDKFKPPYEQVLAALEESAAGREWLEAFHDFIYVKGNGWRMQRMLEYNTPTWIEQPHLAIADIRRLIAVGGVHVPDKHRERMAREREETERELLARVPPDQRQWFEFLMKATQAYEYFCEDHDYWCEFRAPSVVRRAAMEAGRRLVKSGVLEDIDDVLMLLIEHLIMGTAGQERNAAPIKAALKRNKEEWLHNVNLPYPSDEVPLFLGDPSWLATAAGADPLVNIPISPQLAKPEEVGATCVGSAGAPGVAEGTARVIHDHREWDQLQPGEILVAPLTMAPWTPLFSTIKAVVTDTGGVLHHAVIASREYGIPCVAGTINATEKIKTGDKIKVDGNLCRVYIIEERG
jgi:pyruvate,water dikinase